MTDSDEDSREAQGRGQRDRSQGDDENDICEDCQRFSLWEGCAFGCVLMRSWEGKRRGPAA